MKNILANSKEDLGAIDALISKRTPAYRQAYSDRSAWLMACLSELAYLKFNPMFANKSQEDLAKIVTDLIEKKKASSLIKLIDMVGYDPEKEKAKLENELSFLGMKLIKTFDSNGTQAIIVENDNLIALAFRGTEPTSIKDIKSDTKATSTRCESGGKVHSGFKEAYEDVSFDVQTYLDSMGEIRKPLFITGHSLGGALATIAAKRLEYPGGIAACYTFGSPRVGNQEWVSNIKTPLYRLVNAADCVTMMPPGEGSISVVSAAVKLVPMVGEKTRNVLLTRFGGYLHGGNMRYLTNCQNNNYDEVELLYSVSWFFRMKALVVKSLPWKKTLTDHSISIYRKKLHKVANNRN